ncbi:hypothetical protein MMB17_01520 [Methylobacterium organophilum]|uniref:hypothetical protein n=1 Tax=Methylobacterium organophilum TaxID=410 RepID=UPI001F12B581|nr:hypothetical protein [Methylobacterium organophilum]UMY18062.1 hypothetical protein MMB17_01520 [Methylobacterium organophilum]
MSFLLRASLVIGVLSYLAATRGGEAPALPKVSLTASDAAALLDAVPEATRQRLLKEGSAELARRLAAPPASTDTLNDNDRHPAWRGVVDH